MADAVDTEVLFNGTRKYVVRCTNISDTTGESGVTKVDRSGLTGPNGAAPGKLVVEEIWYSVHGFDGVQIDWDATTDERLAVVKGQGYMDYRPYGGLVPDTAGSGADGDILFTTLAAAVPAAGDNYDITLVLRLKD